VPPAGSERNRWTLWLALACSAAVWLAFVRGTSMIYEDALITYRYAENLALGRGFVYNPGERVLGTTSPLYALLLAAPAAVLGVARIPLISNVLALLAGLAGQAFLYAALVRAGAGARTALVALVLVAVQPAVLWSVGSGMETPLVFCLMAASLYASVAGRWHLAMLACGLLVVTRVDGVVWALVIAAAMGMSLRKGAWKPVWPALAVALPWLAFSWLYFGSPLPHSVVAKLAIRPNAGHVDHVAWFGGAFWLNQPLHRLPAALVPWAVFVVIGAGVVLASRLRRLAPLVVFPILFMGFLWIGHAPMFPWYMTPAAWCVAILAAIGLARAAAAAGGMAAMPARAVAWSVVALCAISTGWAIVRRDLRMAEYARIEQANETGLRRRAGEWLAERLSADASVAMEAVGYQGTYARRRIIDLAGLISPEVVAIRRESASNAETFDGVLRTLRPDAVVLRTFEVERNRHAHGGPLFETAAQRDSFFAHYAEAARFVAPYPRIWGENAALTIWFRTR